MFKSLALWKGIFTNPVEGFKGINNETKVAFPIILLILLSVITGSMLIPMLTNNDFAATMIRLIEKMSSSGGTQMTVTQRTEMEKYMTSDTGKIISAIQYTIGYPINIVGAIFLGGLCLMVIGKIFKAQIDYGKSLRIMLFSLIVIVIGTFIKTGIAVLSDWKSTLSATESIYDINSVLSANLSLAAFFTPATFGRIPYFIVTFITDVFNIGCAFFIISGLRSVCTLETKKAIAVTAILFALPLLTSVVPMFFLPA